MPHVAVFDSAFHRTIPVEASTLRDPARAGARSGGSGATASTASPSRRSPSGSTRRRLVVCHLGGGCSVTAVLDGRSVDTTMGFSPLEGVADGDALRLGRPGRAPLPAPRARAHRRRARPRARAGVGARRARRARRPARLRASSPTASRRRSRRWRQRSAASTCSRSRGGVGENRADVRDAVAGAAPLPRRLRRRGRARPRGRDRRATRPRRCSIRSSPQPRRVLFPEARGRRRRRSCGHGGTPTQDHGRLRRLGRPRRGRSTPPPTSPATARRSRS